MNHPPINGRAKLAEQVAIRIEQKVAMLGWPVGTVIGSESQLLQEHGVSRAVLREAVRLVEHHNVAVMKRGPGGGLVVTEPDVSAVVRAVSTYLDRTDATAVHLFDARTVLELHAVGQAGRLLSEDGIIELRECLAAERRPDSATGRPFDSRLHQRLARLSGNPALALLVECLITLTDRETLTGGETLTDGEPGIESRSNRGGDERFREAHATIVDALIAGDVPLAQHRMNRHLSELRTTLAEAHPLTTSSRR